MTITPSDFRVPSDKPVHLKKWATDAGSLYESAKEYNALLAADIGELSALQRLLYASNSYSLLLIFQGMDAAGKDGVISHILTGVNPQGCEVYSFKHPTEAALEQDFLWRAASHLPARGRIGVFNRSYYEEVLIVKVHPKVLQAEGNPDLPAHDKKIWKGRYQSIVDLERHLHRNGTRVLKFFLHLSKDEQRQRFLSRIDEADKNWKFNQADFVERKFWDEYVTAYEDCLTATTTETSPWFIVPADDKSNTRLIVSRIIIDELKTLDLHYPQISRARKDELQTIRKQLAQP